MNADLKVNQIVCGDGIIKLDSQIGKKIGFTSDKFEGYLWKKGEYIWISFIISKKQGKGNLRKLFDGILSFGYGIKVPTPFARMEWILKKYGFVYTQEPINLFSLNETCEIWVFKR